MRSDAVAPYAPVVIKLLQQVVYHDDTAIWNALLLHQNAIQAYCATIGLALYLNEAEGFAYLHQPAFEEETTQRVVLPRLTRRDKLSYHATLLCVLLREQLDQFDASNPESDRLILSAEQLRDLLRPWIKERNDERTWLRHVGQTVSRVVELGILKQLTGGDQDRYEVRRILKARFDSEKLTEIKEKLRAYGSPDHE